MPTYVTLVRYTEQGIRTIKEGPTRLEALKKALKAAGGELKGFYLAMGKYDAVVISEGPNDEAATKVSVSIAMLGNVRTETMRVFDEAEFRKLVASLP